MTQINCPSYLFSPLISSAACLFFQEMKLIFPNSQRINRGNYEIKQLIDSCRSNNVTDFVMLRETRGVPGEQLLSWMSSLDMFPFRVRRTSCSAVAEHW